jgi:FkbM family methyltransferase
MEAVTIEAYGLKYVVDRNSKFIVKESYELYMKDVIKLKSGNVFVDIGAHAGKYSFYASRQVGDSGLVIAIEPHPKNMQNLKKGIKLNRLTNITEIQKACSNYQGKGFLKEYELSAKHELTKITTQTKVEVDTLDSILNHLHLRRVDAVKIDVNGAEYEVLQGAHETLAKFKPLLILEVAVDLKKTIFKYLGELGYKHKILCKTKNYYDALFTHDN